MSGLIKSLVSFLLFLFVVVSIFASNRDVYVIFTSRDEEKDSAGVFSGVQKDWDKAIYRYQPRIFFLADKSKGYHFIFIYSNKLEEPDKPMLKEDESFLNGKHRIDWDVASGTFADREQAETQISNHILCYDNIYFIDKWENETFEEQVVENGTLVTRTRTLITIYPVERFQCDY